MVEARDVRMGQWGFSNQVSHHIPWMYSYVGQPARTQEKVREVLARLYVGSEIGQGYAGDEDNGETSAWYLFAALGLYPLQVGSPTYVIGSPLFPRGDREPGERQEAGHRRAAGNSARNIYVQSLKVDGQPYHQDLPAPRAARRRRGAGVRDGTHALALGHRRRRRAPLAHRRARRRPAPCGI